MQLTSTELIEHLQLPKAIRDEIEIWSEALESISPPLMRALAEIAARLGVSAGTAKSKYYAFRDHGWRGLINRAKLSRPNHTNLHPDFIEWWKSLCEQNGRRCLPAYRKFIKLYQSGEPIPGLDHGVPRGNDFPKGFSYDNLVRFAPKKFELTAARIGRSAAADFRPKVINTRGPASDAPALRVGERYVFDDLWHDFEVVSLLNSKDGGTISTRSQRARLLQLHAHDLAAACQFARGLKPRLRDDATGKSIQLKSGEMIFLLAHVLTEFGYHPDGCIMMVEHGTAAIEELIEQLLYDLTNGCITVDRSGLEGVSAFAGQYPGRSKGNFRFKASLESLGNLIHNETADMSVIPGQTGSNSRLNLPEELHGRQRHADALLNAIADLPSHVAAQLRLPFLEVNVAKWLVHEIMERINRRTDHEIEGWLESGYTTTDLFIPGISSSSLSSSSSGFFLSSSDYLKLAPDRRAAIDALAIPSPRRLSPREVFDNGRANLVRFRPEQTAKLLLSVPSSRHEVIVGQDHVIRIQDKDIAPSELQYLAHHFAPGDKFSAAVNPWSLDSLHLFDAKEAWLGVVKLWQRPAHTDPEAIHRQMGEAAKVERELLAPVAARGLALTRKRLEDSQHNAAVLTGENKKAAAELDSARASLKKAAQSF